MPKAGWYGEIQTMYPDEDLDGFESLDCPNDTSDRPENSYFLAGPAYLRCRRARENASVTRAIVAKSIYA